MNRVSVFSLSKKFRGLEKEAKEAAKLALTYLKKGGVQLEIYLISDQRMQLLNKEFRKRDKITDVLSFKERSEKWPHPESRLSYLGEIYLAPGHIHRRGENLGRLTIHGLLHLLGYTHTKKSDRIEMERLEEKILSYG
ncbi:MAG: rRNA maturation RNase YbeY [Patescibacteria group bacterium]|nr:rRNA maturation RNase YbeY [Patescibacteria group bacterium]